MAQITNTEAGAVQPQLWDTEILQARYAKMVIGTRVLNKAAEVKGKGVSIHIPVLPKFAGGTVSSAGAFTSEAQTITDINVVINTWKYVSAEIKDDTAEQSFANLETAFLKGFGEQLALFSDTDLAGLWTGITNTAVGDPVNSPPFDDANARLAILTLANVNIPLDNVSFILPPIAFYNGIYTLDRFVTAEKTGLSKSITLTGQEQPIYGIPTFRSTVLTQVGTTWKGLLIHRETFALAMQFNNRFERVRKTPAGTLSTILIVNNLYGTLTVRGDHGVVINIRTT